MSSDAWSSRVRLVRFSSELSCVSCCFSDVSSDSRTVAVMAVAVVGGVALL